MTSTNLKSDINLYGLTRQQALIAAIAMSHLTFAELGRRLNISGVAARNLCLADTVPPTRHEQMKAVFEEHGIDTDLLPPGVYTPPGRRPQNQIEAERAAD